MDTITLIFTRRRWNPVSWLIRWALPQSRFYVGQASHCMICDGTDIIEANMLHGVRRVNKDEALKGAEVVDIIGFQVPDALAGRKWLAEQIGKPYDWRGAFGLALAPERNWQEESDWFCFELAAAALAKAGRRIFIDEGHITGTMLQIIHP